MRANKTHYFNFRFNKEVCQVDITKALVYALAELATENKNLQERVTELDKENWELSLENNSLKEALKCQK